MEQKEQILRTEFVELSARLQDPAIFSDTAYPRLAKRRSELEDILGLYDERRKLQHDKAEAETLRDDSDDADLHHMAVVELEELAEKIRANEDQLIEALTPQDPNNDRDVIMEIRAAAGGDEASLFAAELYRMYARWAEMHGFKLELISESPS